MTVRTIPLIIENNTAPWRPRKNSLGAMDFEEIPSGFPFDRKMQDNTSSSSTPSSRNSHIDEFVRRHPEFADHVHNIRPTQRSSLNDDDVDMDDNSIGSRFKTNASPFTTTEPANTTGHHSNHSNSSGNAPVERVIPIFVEGRDEPVLPKQERIVGGGLAQSQASGAKRPGAARHNAPHASSVGVDPPPKVPSYTSSPTPPAPPPTPKDATPPPVPPTTNPVTPIDVIQSIQKDVSLLMAQVEQFRGARNDKQYLYLDEMLTRNLIKLDNIDTQGQDNIRQARREAIKCIERCIAVLEAKANSNNDNSLPEVNEELKQQPQQDHMEMVEQHCKESEKLEAIPTEVSHTTASEPAKLEPQQMIVEETKSAFQNIPNSTSPATMAQQSTAESKSSTTQADKKGGPIAEQMECTPGIAEITNNSQPVPPSTLVDQSQKEPAK